MKGNQWHKTINCENETIFDCFECILSEAAIGVFRTNVCLTLCTHYLHVEMCEATSCGQGQFDHTLHSDGVTIQVVKQGAVFMVV